MGSSLEVMGEVPKAFGSLAVRLVRLVRDYPRALSGDRETDSKASERVR